MSNDWIKMRANLWDDPRVASIVDATDSSEAMVIGALYWLWATADQHTEDGIMPGLTLRQIDRKTGLPGFGNALVKIGWVAEHPDGARIVRFDEHNGASAKRRASESRRKMSARNADKLQNDCTDDAGESWSGRGGFAHLEIEEVKEKANPPYIPPLGGSSDGQGNGHSAKPRGRATSKLSFDEFRHACREAGQRPIPEDDPVFAYAEGIGLPHDFLVLAWRWFQGRYADKRQAGIRGWRQTFRNAVEGNWPKFWYADDGGGWALTTAGKQAQMAMKASEVDAGDGEAEA